MMRDSSRRHLRRRAGFRGPSWRCPVSTSCSISQSLALGANQREIGARHVVISGLDPIRISEIEFGQIPLQVGFGYVLIDAVIPRLRMEK